jgi:hypothetical protein
MAGDRKDVEHYRREAERLRKRATRAHGSERAHLISAAEAYEQLANSTKLLNSSRHWPLPDRKSN